MRKPSKQLIHDVQLSLCWVVLFSLIISSYALWALLGKIKNLNNRLDVCQNNIEEIMPQIKSSHVILDLKGGTYDQKY